MRGARFWRPDALTHITKCSEFISDACDPVPTDTCCAVIPCSYCVTWAPYGEGEVKAVADFVVDGWYAAIGSVEFRGFWERNYDTGECEFVVTLNDVEVYRNDCYGGVTCRDASDSTDATIGYDTGTLTWAKIEPRPLEYVTDYDTNCRKHFCGVCECSCDCLCVTITDSYDVVTNGEICDTSYPCDGPVWEGTVGDYVLAIALGRDEYDNCIVTPTVNGVELDSVAANGCGAMSATIALADGTVITLACKVCTCAEDWVCCPGIPTPTQLYLTIHVISQICGCLDGQVILMLPNGTAGGYLNYLAIWQWTCPDLLFPANVAWFKFTTSCNGGSQFLTINISRIDQLDTDPPPEESDGRWAAFGNWIYYLDSGQCDPFYWHFSDGGGTGDGVWIRCQDDFQDSPEIHLELTL